MSAKWEVTLKKPSGKVVVVEADMVDDGHEADKIEFKKYVGSVRVTVGWFPRDNVAGLRRV